MLITLVNSKTKKDTVEANKYGKMDHNMKDSGKMIYLILKAESSIKMENIMKASGRMEKPMDLEYIKI
jgi:hypothetical protein